MKCVGKANRQANGVQNSFTFHLFTSFRIDKDISSLSDNHVIKCRCCCHISIDSSQQMSSNIHRPGINVQVPGSTPLRFKYTEHRERERERMIEVHPHKFTDQFSNDDQSIERIQCVK